jgi:hypothetical protein
MGNGLSKIVQFLGAAQRAHHLIPILEHLSTIEDIAVRNKVYCVINFDYDKV